MRLNPFKKSDEKKKKSTKNDKNLSLEEKISDINTEKPAATAKINYLPGAHKILKNFYISEKATNMIANNQYVFIVGDRANKSEIRKNVEKIFNVKIKDVKIINVPSKTRNVGRHSGFKTGFKKAIVVLKEGYSIQQAKA
jgi:large subunit ribosomal protein L23